MKIISGGQSGADLGAILFAKKHFIPCKINTFEGFKPVWGELPCDTEIEYVCDIGNYVANLRERTCYNVMNSDFTLILLQDNIEFTKGSKLTYNLCCKLKKNVLYVNINTNNGIYHDRTWSLGNIKVIHNIESVTQVIKTKNPEVLNVAGQRELNQTSVVEFMEKVLC